MDSFLLILDSFKFAFSLLFSLWWVYFPVLSIFIAYTAIQNYTNLKFRLGLKWVLLEIKIPKEINKSPKAMELIFAGLHGVYSSSLDWKDKFIDGKVPTWYSFEIVGNAGETHFYIRVLEQLRNLVESQVYAQYPEAEVIEVQDYVHDMPLNLPDEKYDLWGTDLILSKPDAYPIRTYPEFEEKPGSPNDVKRVDPLASLAELFNTLHPEERIWIQFLGAPSGDDWIKRGQAELDKLMGKESPPPKGDFISEMVFSVDKAISGFGASPTEEKKEEKKRVDLSPGKQEIMKAMEKSWDKLGYDVAIRYIYIGPRDNFHQAHIAAITGAFRQFSSQNLNGFRPNKFTITVGKGFNKLAKALKRKRILYQAYKERKLFAQSVKRFVLNTEELATIFHFPDTGVRSPLLPRVEAKKGEPPTSLPIG